MNDVRVVDADDEAPWIDQWKAQGFSWKRLEKHAPWQPEVGGTLQDYLRRFEGGGASDESLKADGILIECGSAGLYHILFVPPQWAKSKRSINFTSEELQERQAGYWTKLFSNKLAPERFRGTVSGVHLPSAIAQQLIAGYRVSFNWSSFEGSLTGLPKRGTRTFENCLFKGEINLSERLNETPPPTLRFLHCEFDAGINVSDLDGMRDVAFHDCIVGGRLDFEGSCGASIKIQGCTLTTFDSLGCTFIYDVDIFESVVLSRFSLSSCTFEKAFALVAVDLGSSLELLNCDFKGRATFATITWPPSGRLGVTAEGSKFHEIVSFSGGVPPARFFGNAEFKSSVSLSSATESTLEKALADELGAPSQKGQSDYALSVENGCRTLRKLAEGRGDVHQEHFWHKSEIVARRTRGESAPSESVFSMLYGFTADYGLSISRPFIILLATVIIFSVIYAWLGGPQLVGPRLDLKSLEEGVGFSLNRTIPIGAFTDERNPWRKALLGGGGQGFHIAIRTIATLQSILSAVLIYLGVMAIRRKFRIS